MKGSLMGKTGFLVQNEAATDPSELLLKLDDLHSPVAKR